MTTDRTDTMSSPATTADDAEWARELGRQARAARERHAAEASARQTGVWAARQYWARELTGWWPAFALVVERAVKAWSAESGIAVTYTTSGAAPFTRLIVGTVAGSFSVSLIPGELPSLDIALRVGRRADHGPPLDLDEPMEPAALAHRILAPFLTNVAAAVAAEEAHAS